MKLPLCVLVGAAVMLAQVMAEPVKVLRVGDSITRLTATNPVLFDKLTEAGLEVTFVGSQKPHGDRPGLQTACEGFNGRPLEFFTRFQKTYGDEPYSDGFPMAEAIPLKRALEEEKPDVVLAMVGVNNMQGKEPAIQEEALKTEFTRFLNKLEEWSGEGVRFVISTIPPANDPKDPGNPHRNERHRLFNEKVVKPLVEARIAEGKPYVLVDVYAALEPEAHIKDSVHPNNDGKTLLNTLWAEGILKALGKAPATSGQPAEAGGGEQGS